MEKTKGKRELLRVSLNRCIGADVGLAKDESFCQTGTW